MGVVLGPGDLPVQPLSRERARGKFTVGRGPGGSTLPSHAQGVGLMDYNASILIDPHAVFPFDQGTDTKQTPLMNCDSWNTTTVSALAIQLYNYLSYL